MSELSDAYDLAKQVIGYALHAVRSRISTCPEDKALARAEYALALIVKPPTMMGRLNLDEEVEICRAIQLGINPAAMAQSDCKDASSP